MIDRMTTRTERPGSRLRTGAALAVGLLLVVGTAYAAAPAADGSAAAAVQDNGSVTGVTAASEETLALAALEQRVERVTAGWAELDQYYDANVAPIEQVLQRYTTDDALASRVAAAVVREADAARLHPRLLLGVLLVENPWLDPTARSSVGAVGLMQIMPVHQGGWECGWDLEQIDTNVCLGARVFAHYLQRTGGNVEKALLRYNGCVNGTNTPNCHQYPSRVLARSGGALVAWAGGQGASAGSP